jgi:hypothetical protein
VTYNLTDHLNILATNNEDATGDVTEEAFGQNVNALNSVLHHEIAWIE